MENKKNCDEISSKIKNAQQLSDAEAEHAFDCRKCSLKFKSAETAINEVAQKHVKSLAIKSRHVSRTSETAPGWAWFLAPRYCVSAVASAALLFIIFTNSNAPPRAPNETKVFTSAADLSRPLDIAEAEENQDDPLQIDESEIFKSSKHIELLTKNEEYENYKLVEKNVGEFTDVDFNDKINESYSSTIAELDNNGNKRSLDDFLNSGDSPNDTMPVSQ